MAARPVGAASRSFDPLGGENAQDGVEQRRLADAGAAGDDRRLGAQHHLDRGALRRGERLPRLFLDPGDGLVDVDRRPWRRPLRQRLKPIGDASLGEIEPAQEHAGPIVDRVGDDLAVREFMFNAVRTIALVDFEQGDSQLDKILDRQPAMAVVSRLLQGEGNSRAHPLRRFPRHAQLHGDGVGGPKADAANVAGEPIRVLGHDLDGVMAVGLEDAHRARRPDAMGMQEDHDVADGLLLGPAGGDLPRAEFADARHLPQLLGARLDDFEGPLAERADDSLGEHRADAANHARAEIFLDAFRRRRRRGLEQVRLELKPMRAIRDPDADGVDELAGRDRRDMTDDRHEIALAARLHLQDGETIVLVVKGHPLDGADERFSGRRSVD